jgi:hypothetical protein
MELGLGNFSGDEPASNNMLGVTGDCLRTAQARFVQDRPWLPPLIVLRLKQIRRPQ